MCGIGHEPGRPFPPIFAPLTEKRTPALNLQLDAMRSPSPGCTDPGDPGASRQIVGQIVGPADGCNADEGQIVGPADGCNADEHYVQFAECGRLSVAGLD